VASAGLHDGIGDDEHQVRAIGRPAEARADADAHAPTDRAELPWLRAIEGERHHVLTPFVDALLRGGRSWADPNIAPLDEGECRAVRRPGCSPDVLRRAGEQGQ